MTDELFTVVDLDDPDAVRTAAAQLLQATRDVAEAMDHASGRWSMLENQWVAPESGILNEALLTPQSDAGNLASAGYQAQGTLANFASRLDELADQRRRLLTDIGEFHEDRTDDGDDDDEARGDLIADLQRRCHALAAAKDEAQNICRSALGGIETQASADRAVSTRCRLPAKLMTSRPHPRSRGAPSVLLSASLPRRHSTIQGLTAPSGLPVPE